MKLTEELVDSMMERIQDNLSMYQEEGDFDINYIESTLRDLDGGFQEIEVKINYRPSGESDSKTTIYYKSVYEDNISDLESVVFDDIMAIVCPED